MIKRVLRDPLLHFLALGLGVFLVYGVFLPKENKVDPNTIVIDRDRLLTFMQYRARSFTGERYDQILDSLPPEQRQRLIDDYVREEALYREAKALKLDENDYSIRQRLIRNMEFITQGFLSATETINDQMLDDYYKTNKNRYREPARITFTHVFINGQQRGWDKGKTLAEQTLALLNSTRVPFHGAVSHGDRFLYHTNYVDKEADLVASHFGLAMKKQLFALPDNNNASSNKQWHGPFRSPYGFHLVMVTRKSEAYIPVFATVQDRVLQDTRQANREAILDKAIKAVIDTYNVTIDQTLKPDSKASLNNKPDKTIPSIVDTRITSDAKETL